VSNNNLRRRLDNLEAKPCPECNARPTQVHVTYPEPLLPNDEDRPVPAAQHCPECGKEIERAVIKVVYDR